MYSEEKDLSLRLCRAGWRTFFVPAAEILHYGERSTFLIPVKMYLELQRSQALFFYKFYPAGYAFTLCVSWEFMLCIQTYHQPGIFSPKRAETDLSCFYMPHCISRNSPLKPVLKKPEERPILTDRNIVCFSSDWRQDPLSKHHIMSRLSKRNRILWVNSIGLRTPTATAHDAARVIAKLKSFFGTPSGSTRTCTWYRR